MNADIVRTAASKLELLNIVLHESHLTRDPNHDDPANYPDSLMYQNKLAVKSEEAVYKTDSKRIRIFRVYVSLGKRGAKEESDASEKSNQPAKAKVYFTIEATFRVDYLMKAKLTEDEVDEFSQLNAVHNVWPFWREHVYEVVRKAELPRLSVPLMRITDTKSQKRKKMTKGRTGNSKSRSLIK